ncbi:MAG TPA: FAD-dependent monooxygenase [Candidatus Dormibacteraeota bacterium]|jgi:flavin-dependent dehydrogenase
MSAATKVTNRETEAVDVVVVGARCAGSAAAIALAKAGRRVVALDRATFPSDTLSTHVIFPSGIAQLARLGALERVLASGVPKCRRIMLSAAGVDVVERYRAVEGIDYAMCMPRPALDLALVSTARGFGAEVREHSGVTGVLWEGDRAAGVRYRAEDGATREIRAPLVIGADGRRSTVASLVGAEEPYRGSRNGRGLAFWYMDDPKAGTPWRDVLVQWRIGEVFGMVFPTPDDRMLVLFMGPAEDIPRFQKDARGMWEQMLRQHRRLADRVEGAGNPTKLRATADTSSYFRASSGPGWALVGDAGHFKDPIIAQGIGDALLYGRLVGECAGRTLDDPRALDRALLEWEAQRDRDCLPAYHWANNETRVEPLSRLTVEAFRSFAAAPDQRNISDMFSRVRRPETVISFPRMALWLARALMRPGAPRRSLVREGVRETRIHFDVVYEGWRREFRSRRVAASDHPGWRRVPAPAAARPTPAAAVRTPSETPEEALV